MKFLLATGNRHKLRELSELLREIPVEWIGLDAFPSLAPVVEDRPTLEGNAEKKAREPAAGTGLWTLAEDTGLEVAALGGAPGVFSARFAGPGCDYAANNRKLLAALEGVPQERRGAVFRTVAALAEPGGSRVLLEEGRLEGVIARSPRGENGFGYDPIFMTPSGKTLAELSSVEKNSLSHRSRALARMLPHLRRAASAALVLAALFAPPARAGRTEPGQESIWDQIMAAQANRGLRVGSRYMDLKQYDLAEAEFTQAVNSNPRDASAHLMLGAAYYWQGKVDQSLAEYRTALELDPASSQAYMLIGISLAWKGETMPSFEAFKKASELEPDRADVNMNMGSILETLGRNAEALRHFRRAVSLEPRSALYHFQLGMLYRRLGRDSDAVDSMREALKLMGAFEDALLELGAAEERLGDRKAAISNFKKAVSLKARDSVARFRLGRLYLLSGQKELARQVFSEAFHLTPEGEGSGLQLSVSYSGGKRKAPPAGEPAGKPPPAPARDPNDPLEVFARNLERIPLEQDAVLQVDVAFVPKPKLVQAPASEAPTSLKKALEKGVGSQHERDRAATKVTRREFKIKSGSPQQRAAQIEKVLNDLDSAMKGAPEGADVRLGMNLTFTRPVDAVAGRAPAEGSPKVSYQPRQVGNDLGLWVIGTGWMALVEEVLPESGEAPGHPDDADWWVGTGLGYATVGDGQRALAAFERAVRLDSSSELAYLGRGVASVMTGDDAGAQADYRRVLDINPRNRAAREGLKWLMRPTQKKTAGGEK